jgi:hypothetical protein
MSICPASWPSLVPLLGWVFEQECQIAMEYVQTQITIELHITLSFLMQQLVSDIFFLENLYFTAGF